MKQRMHSHGIQTAHASGKHQIALSCIDNRLVEIPRSTSTRVSLKHPTIKNAQTATSISADKLKCKRVRINAERKGQRREPAADDVEFVSERIGWLPFAGPLCWMKFEGSNTPSNSPLF